MIKIVNHHNKREFFESDLTNCFICIYFLNYFNIIITQYQELQDRQLLVFDLIFNNFANLLCKSLKMRTKSKTAIPR